MNSETRPPLFIFFKTCFHFHFQLNVFFELFDTFQSTFLVILLFIISRFKVNNNKRVIHLFSIKHICIYLYVYQELQNTLFIWIIMFKKRIFSRYLFYIFCGCQGRRWVLLILKRLCGRGSSFVG